MRRVLVEKDRQLESLRLHSLHIESECQKHRETIQRLTGTSGSVGSESSLLERVEALEAAKVRLEAELAEARSSPTPHGTPSHQDMSTSIALCDGDGGLRDAATSPDPARKTQLKEKLSKSTTTLIQQGRVSVGSCNIGDAVLVVWEENYHSYMILQESSTLYFLHPDSLAAMSLFPSSDGSPRQIYYCTAEVVEKEYCHARKAQKNDKDWTVQKRLLSARRALQMAVFDNKIERWGEVDVPYLPSQLIGSYCNE
ncbi:reticulophagy [Homalodisca vitripennis]|nr:reticulophagy [Homalodisca vitripennis]